MESIEAIGVIHSPFTNLTDMPIQPGGASGVTGTVIVNPEYIEGLQDLDGFSHIYLIYLFHKAQRTELMVTPFMDTEKRGVFATRSPLRPNHIGISIVELKEVEQNNLLIGGVDVLDNTPLLDIKPYIENFDAVNHSRSGWMQAGQNEVKLARSDKRFV